MIISGNVIAQKAVVDNVEIDDVVSVQLPSIELQSGEIKGAGVLGTIDMPSLGQVNSMTVAMSMRSINLKATNLAAPGVHNVELRFAKDTLTSDGITIPEGSKIFIRGVTKKYDPGKVENGSTMDGSVEMEALRYRQVIDGSETLLIDKQNYIYAVNGKDYMAEVKGVLG